MKYVYMNQNLLQGCIMFFPLFMPWLNNWYQYLQCQCQWPEVTGVPIETLQLLMMENIVASCDLVNNPHILEIGISRDWTDKPPTNLSALSSSENVPTNICFVPFRWPGGPWCLLVFKQFRFYLRGWMKPTPTHWYWKHLWYSTQSLHLSPEGLK